MLLGSLMQRQSPSEEEGTGLSRNGRNERLVPLQLHIFETFPAFVFGHVLPEQARQKYQKFWYRYLIAKFARKFRGLEPINLAINCLEFRDCTLKS
jgi:hypothetical protein